MLLSNEYYISMISYYNFPSDVLLSCIKFIVENENYDNYINLLDNFLKQLLNKDNSEDIQNFKKKAYLILYKNFKQNLFPQFINSFSIQEKDKIISNHLNNINELFEHNHTIEFLFQNLSSIKKLSEWLIFSLKITEHNFETFLKVCKILMKNNDQKNLFLLVKYNFFYLKHIQNEVFDFLSDTCKYRLFYKENNDYIQYKCYQYFVRNNIKLNDFDMPDEAKQLFWIEPYFLSTKLKYFFKGFVDCKSIYNLAYDIFIGQNETLKNGLKPEVLSMLKVFGPYLNEDGTIVYNFTHEIDVYQSPKFINPLFQKLDIMKKIKLYPKYQPKKVKELIKLIMFSATNNMNDELTKMLSDQRIKDLEKNKLMKLLDDVYKVYLNDKKCLAQFIFYNYLEFISDTLLNTIVCFNSKSYKIFNQIQNRLWIETKTKLCKKISKKVIRQLKWEKYVFIDEKEEEEEEFCLNNLF